MAPQDRQDSADSNSEAASTYTAVSQEAPANAARGRGSLTHSRDGKELKVRFSADTLVFEPGAASAKPQDHGASDAASTDGNSASQAAFSQSPSSPCVKKAQDGFFKHSCLKNTKCLKKKPCLKDTAKDNQGGQESLASTDGQAETMETSAGRASDRSSASADAKAKPRVNARGTTPRDHAPDADSSMASCSAVESGSELEVSDKNDDASTGASTPGADSSKGDSSDEQGPSTSKDKSGGVGSIDSGGWSISEDCLLRSMKESKDNLPWAEIGHVLGRHSNDVKARWVVIRDIPAQFASSEEASGEEQESSAQESQGASELSKKLARAPDETSSAVEDESQGASEPAKEHTGKGKGKAAVATKWHKGQRNDKVAMENKSARSKAAEANERERDILSGEEASSESSGPLCGEEDDDDDEDDEAGGFHYGWPESNRQDARYMRNHLYPELYPGVIDPEPDEFFGEHDCAVLAAVDSKYKQSRWLEMQANFYNVTGRMVPLHLIRDKCERAERDSAEQQQPSLPAGGRWQRVENWVDGVPDGDLEDPAL